MDVRAERVARTLHDVLADAVRIKVTAHGGVRLRDGLRHPGHRPLLETHNRLVGAAIRLDRDDIPVMDVEVMRRAR